MTDALDWDEFRIVRAIAAARSLSGAAERLGVNHSTLFRRLAALEARLRVKLFERERSGYRPTPTGEDMVALADLMGDTIAEFERRVGGNEMKPSGRVRLTTFNSLGALVLPPICAALCAAHPAVHVELSLTEASFDLMVGEADIGLHCLKQPPPVTVTGRQIAPLPWAIYAVAAFTSPSGEAAPGCPWVAPSENFRPLLARRWVDSHVELWRRAATASNAIVMAELAARGVGAALLPCYVAVAKPELVRVGEADPELHGDLWLTADERALRAPRVRAVYDFLGDELDRRRPWFAGEAVVGA